MIKNYKQYIKESLLDKLKGPNVDEISKNFIDGKIYFLRYKRILNENDLKVPENILNIGFKKGYIEVGLYLHLANEYGYKYISIDELNEINFRIINWVFLQKSLHYGYFDGVKYICDNIDKDEYKEFTRSDYWEYDYKNLSKYLDIITYLNDKGFLEKWDVDKLLKVTLLNGEYKTLDYVLSNCNPDKIEISHLELTNPMLRKDGETIKVLLKHGFYIDREKYLNTALKYKLDDIAELFIENNNKI